jgi:3-hydroxy-9,10-secoandrosta-1,3,5(10)-triene-9,17-dione monooxygenase reductase component
VTDEEDAPKIAGVSSARFREVMGHFGTGVTIVTGMDGEEPVGFTCQSFMSLSLDPPLIAIAPGKSSTSWPRIAPGGRFCVNMLSEKQEALCRDFAVSGAEKGVTSSGASVGNQVLIRFRSWRTRSPGWVAGSSRHTMLVTTRSSLERWSTQASTPPVVHFSSIGAASVASSPEHAELSDRKRNR